MGGRKGGTLSGWVFVFGGMGHCENKQQRRGHERVEGGAAP